MKVHYNKWALAIRYAVIALATWGLADSAYQYNQYNDRVEYWFTVMFLVVLPFVIYSVVINTIMPIAEIIDGKLLVMRWPLRPKIFEIVDCTVENTGWGISIADKYARKYTFFKCEIPSSEYASLCKIFCVP